MKIEVIKIQGLRQGMKAIKYFKEKGFKDVFVEQKLNEKIGKYLFPDVNGILCTSDHPPFNSKTIILSSNKMHSKVLEFAKQMQKELDDNAHKGDWNEWKNVEEILNEFEYHKAKLLIALRKKQPHEECKELIADCANLLLFLGNSGDLYNQNKQ